jgi:hypothetical protein
MNWLSAMITSDALRLDTLDTVAFHPLFHILIETEILENVTPAFLSFGAILPMTNIQIYRAPAIDRTVCDMSAPELLFARMEPKLEITFGSHFISKMKAHFVGIAPAMVDHVYQLKNHLFYVDDVYRTPEHAVLLVDHLCSKALQFAVSCIREFKANDSILKEILVYAFFKIFSGILDSAVISSFDSWCRQAFDLAVPPDWVDFDVSQLFWDCFPRPYLQAMYYREDALVPLDFRVLERNPMACPPDSVCLPRRVAVYTPHFLPSLRIAATLLTTRENIFLYGPRLCGKTSFLRLLLVDEPAITPVYIPVSSLSTCRSLFHFIQKRTSVTIKDVKLMTQAKLYALIFENVMPEHTATIEFIRMIISQGTVPIVSPNDPKMLEMVQLKHYFVVVTSTTITDFSPRFIAQFTPVQLFEPTFVALRHVFVSIAKMFHIQEDFAGKVFGLFNPSPRTMLLLDLLSTLPQNECANEKDIEVMLKVAVREFHFLFLHSLTLREDRDDFNASFMKEFPVSLSDRVLDEFNTGKVFMSFDPALDQEQRTLCTKIVTQPEHLLSEELAFHYNTFNCRPHEKIILFFTSQVIQQYSLLQRALIYPGTSVIIKAGTGTGKRTVTRFVARIKRYEYIDLPSDHIDKETAVRLLGSLVEEVAINKKTYLAFLRMRPANRVLGDLVLQVIESGNFSCLLKESELDALYVNLGRAVVDAEPEARLVHFHINWRCSTNPKGH